MNNEFQIFKENTKLFIHPQAEENKVLYQDFLNDAVRQFLEAHGADTAGLIDYLRRGYKALQEV